MATFDEIITSLESVTYFQNNLLDYTIAFIYALVSFSALYFIKFGIVKRVINKEKFNKGRLLPILYGAIDKYLSFSTIGMISAYIGLTTLEIPFYLQSFFEILIYGFITYLLLQFSFNVIDAFMQFQLTKAKADAHILEFFKVFARFFVIIILLIWFLSNIGLDVTSFLAGLGIFSLAIAFALKEFVADIFASFILLIDRPFETGDSIKMDSSSGTVEHIGVRSSKIRSADGHLIVASNRELTSKRIHNMKKMDRRRVSLILQVSQNLPMDTLNGIRSIVSDIITSIEEVEFERINFVNIGDYTFDYEFVYFVTKRDFKLHVKIKHQILVNILRAFEENNIELPYPIKTVIQDQ